MWADDGWTGLFLGDPIQGHTFGTDAFATIQDGVNTVGPGNVAHFNNIIGNTEGVTDYDNTQNFDATCNCRGSSTGPSGHVIDPGRSINQVV